MLLLCLAAAACRSADPASKPVLPSSFAADTSWGTFNVTVEPQPSPVPSDRMFGLTIAVAMAKERTKSAGDVTVAVDARMPAHNHGMNLQPKVTSLGNGRFRADGLLFHMPGSWELYVDVTRATETERATFVINVD